MGREHLQPFARIYDPGIPDAFPAGEILADDDRRQQDCSGEREPAHKTAAALPGGCGAAGIPSISYSHLTGVSDKIFTQCVPAQMTAQVSTLQPPGFNQTQATRTLGGMAFGLRNLSR
jgi:hypothetical protein